MNTTIVGDVIIDEYLHGVVVGSNPEVYGGRKIRIIRRELKLGGAAAVASLMIDHGKHPLLASVVSSDPMAWWLLAEAQTQRINTEILWDTYRTTTVKTRILLDGQIQPDRLDSETTEDIREPYALTIAQTPLYQDGVVILVDYNKGVLTRYVCENIIRRAKQRNIPVVVDPAYHKPWTYYRGATLIKANKIEALTELGGDCVLNDAAQILARRHCCRIIITDGVNGMYWADGNNVGHIPICQTTNTIDATGCGDVVMAAVAAEISLPLSEICEFASVEAARCVGRLGVAP